MPESSTSLAYTKLDRAGALSVTLGAAIWGLFWIPLRYLEKAGVHGVWSIVLVLSVALIPAVFFVVRQNQIQNIRQPDTWQVGTCMGLAMMLYFVGILYSDVVRVIFLFYLLPVWTTLAARLIYGEPIRGARLLVLITALIGLWLLLGGNSQLPVPKNIGDWAAILAGMCWGVSLSLLRDKQTTAAFATTMISLGVAIVCCMLFSALLALGTRQAVSEFPPLSTIKDVLLISALFGMIFIFPALLGQIWGARRIPAPTAALLTMTEIVVATVSASWLIGTDLTSAAWAGGLVIILSVCIDLYAQFKQIGMTGKNNIRATCPPDR